jgi:cell wall-associated NlpC family hydrolase
VSSAGPVLIRGRRQSRSVSLVGTIVTVVCCAVGALSLSLRHPAPAAERMTLLPPVQQAAAQVPPANPVLRAAGPVPPGRWTPAIGEEIAQRAAEWLGWPYSFAAGNGNGPTYGHAVDNDSRNDGHVLGFDCSGLTLYALAPWLELTHNAAAQYDQVGSFHPSLGELQPGDLIFWSGDGTVRDIGHVAVYVGDGEVVQAPHSGAVITVTPLYSVERAYIGATRPLT